jgi:predicted RNA-binding Zn-ribbon protein involved in translation (DUF1610 family)
MTSLDVAIETRFHCEHCGIFRRARVLATGQGATNSFQSTETGRERALADARKHAEQTLLFFPCPACGRESKKGGTLQTRLLFFHLAFPLLVLPALSLGYGWVKELGSDELFMLGGISSVGGLFAGVVAYMMRPKPWNGAADRVELLPPKRPEAS